MRILTYIFIVAAFTLGLLGLTGVAHGAFPDPPPQAHHKAHIIPGYYLCLPLLAPKVCYYIVIPKHHHK